MKHSFAKRLLVLMMAALMLLGVSPIGALAEEPDDTPVLETVEQPVEEPVEEPAEEAPAEEAATEPTPEPEEEAEATPEPETTSEPAEEPTEETTEETEEFTEESTEETEEATEETAEETEETTEESTEETAEETAEAASLALEGGSETPAAATTVTVTFAASKDTFIFVPDELTVTDGTAEQYGYTNDSTVTGPTFLDALVAAHVEKYGSSFTKETASNYLVVSGGWISKAFELESGNFCTMVNGKQPTGADGVGLMCNQAQIASGDVLQFIEYQQCDYGSSAADTKCDYYCRFTEMSKSVQKNETFTLTLSGHSLADEMWGLSVTDTPIAGAYVSVCPVKADGSLDTQIADATADENGQIELPINTVGEYLITVSGMTAEENPLTLPWCTVTVGEVKELTFTSGYKVETSADGKTYTVTVPDNKGSLAIKASYDGTIKPKAYYTKPNATEQTEVELANGTNKTLSGVLKNNSNEGNTVAVKLGDTLLYTVNVVRKPTLKSLALADSEGNAFALSKKFAAATETGYEAFAKSPLKVTATATASGSTVTVNGQPVANAVELSWVEHKSELAVVVSNGTCSTTYTVVLKEMPTLAVETPPTKTAYKVGEKFDPTGMKLKATYATGDPETIESKDFTVVTNGTLSTETAVTISYRGATVSQPIIMTERLTKGTGTQDDPYRLDTAEDLDLLSRLTNAGESFAGKYFKITDNITLPEAWTPIGCTKDGSLKINKGANLNAFSGTIDGNNKRITVPAGGLPLLGYVNGATIKNLKIYGIRIEGYGLIDHFYGVGLSGTAVVLDNITLESGSQTLKSGLLGAEIGPDNEYAGVSASFTATIRNCTIEKGVVIGYKGDQDYIGSIAGRFLGTIENCVSHATVKGKDYVGGIIGSRDNSMGTCSVSDCTFDGTVEASGSYVGGIAGAMYVGKLGANAYRIDIKNCLVSGTVGGNENVGGVLGGDGTVYQNWYSAEFTGNTFNGTVRGEKNIGALIGFYRSLNKNDNISGNTYSKLCGSSTGFGLVEYVDTNHENPATVEGTTYVNSETAKPSVSGMTKKGLNRTDDPLGADADKLCSSTGGDTSPTPGEQAAAVEALIEAIGDVTAESKAAIEAARKAYDALSSEAKALVTNYAKLTAAERKLAALDPAGETKAIGTGDTRLVLDGVTYMVDAEAASLMQTIASLRDAGGTDDEGILSAYRTYDAMSSDLKAQVFNFADLEAMCDALGVRAHRDSLSGFAAEGLPWYVGLEISAITSGADYEIVAGSIGHNALLSLWHIEFINRLTGERFTPYDSVTMRVAAPEMSEGLEQFRMALYTDGRVAYSDCTVSGGELVFAVTEGGVYGFIGGTAAATETLAVEPVEEAIAEAEAPEAETAPEAIEPVARPEAESGHTLLWLWIVIGVAGVAALVVVVVLKRQDRKAKHAVK